MMMKLWLLCFVLLFTFSTSTAISSAVGFGFQSSGKSNSEDFYNFKAKALGGREFDFNRFRNKVVLITNVASECGYTNENYKQFLQLKTMFPESEFEILLMPSNDFKQETKPARDIQNFVYGQGDGATELHLLEKSALNGEKQHPLMAWLKKMTKSEDRDISWNFETKFIISKDGALVSRYSESFSPIKLKLTLEHFMKQK